MPFGCKGQFWVMSSSASLLGSFLRFFQARPLILAPNGPAHLLGGDGAGPEANFAYLLSGRHARLFRCRHTHSLG